MESAENIGPILGSHPFLSGFEPEHIALLAQAASMARFGANQYLFHAREKAEHLYLIRQGLIAVEIFDARRGPIMVQTLEGPCVLGWSWLVPPYQWCFDARALSLTRAVALDGAQVRTVCQENHEFGYELLKRCTMVFAERLHASRMQLLEVFQERE